MSLNCDEEWIYALNLLNNLSCGYLHVERSEPCVLWIHGFRTYRELRTVDTYLERTKHFILWTRALRTYRVTLHCAYLNSGATEHFVLCTRSFGTYRSFRTVYVCMRNVLNTLSYVFMSPFVHNILNTYSCGYICSQCPIIDSPVCTCIQNVLNIMYSEYMHL